MTTPAENFSLNLFSNHSPIFCYFSYTNKFSLQFIDIPRDFLSVVVVRQRQVRSTVGVSCFWQQRSVFKPRYHQTFFNLYHEGKVISLKQKLEYAPSCFFAQKFSKLKFLGFIDQSKNCENTEKFDENFIIKHNQLKLLISRLNAVS